MPDDDVGRLFVKIWHDPGDAARNYSLEDWQMPWRPARPFDAAPYYGDRLLYAIDQWRPGFEDVAEKILGILESEPLFTDGLHETLEQLKARDNELPALEDRDLERSRAWHQQD